MPQTYLLDDYQKYLEDKIVDVTHKGFLVRDDQLHPANFPHQNDIIKWAANLGRALIAASFGLGKTTIECELARLIHKHTGKPFLVICPLGVKYQFVDEDGPRLGMTWQYVRTDKEVTEATTPYLITNYERVRDGNINPALHAFGGVSLDEGSVLRSLGSKTSNIFKEVFASVPFRYVATATPSPNDYKELIYYAEFLGIMDHGQALTRWFKRDSAKAGHLTLHASHEEDFWMWIASWAIFIFKPSDLGYDDTGYELPELQVHWRRIKADQTRAFGQIDNKGQRRLLLDATGGVKEAAAEKRETLNDRAKEMMNILEDYPDRHWIIWHHQERERHAIEKMVPGAVTVYGSQDIEEREANIIKFTRGDIRILGTKPELSGSGCNFQYNCHSNIFLGVSYLFQDFIQAVHRTYRYLQAHPVDVYIIYAESEDQVVNVLKRKWQQHDKLINKMRAIIQKYGLSHIAIHNDLKRKIGVKRMETASRLFTAIHNDCVIETKNLPDNSVDLIHTSIPFGNHYEYTTQLEDFGHNATDGDFWKQMDYLIPDLYRVLKPGRVAAIHVKDRILYGHQTRSGFMEVSPFSDECVMAFKKHGWMYEGRRTIVTDVVRENSSTYRLGWTEMTNDASKMGSGLPEYVVLFRKPPSSPDTARADEPVTKIKSDKKLCVCTECGYELSDKDRELEITKTGDILTDGYCKYHAVCPTCQKDTEFTVSELSGYTRARWQIDAHSLWRSDGNSPLLPHELLKSIYDYKAHVERLEALDRKGALPASFFYEPPASLNQMCVWDDVIFMRTLNSEQSRGRQENHICPLPFDIVKRIINLYSNPNDLVLDPFAGLFTVPYMAIKMHRRAIGFELNQVYYECGLKYCQAAEQEVSAPTLFEFAGITV